jgi:hypothetical protein
MHLDPVPANQVGLEAEVPADPADIDDVALAEPVAANCPVAVPLQGNVNVSPEPGFAAGDPFQDQLGAAELRRLAQRPARDQGTAGGDNV